MPGNILAPKHHLVSNQFFHNLKSKTNLIFNYFSWIGCSVNGRWSNTGKFFHRIGERLFPASEFAPKTAQTVRARDPTAPKMVTAPRAASVADQQPRRSRAGCAARGLRHQISRNLFARQFDDPWVRTLTAKLCKNDLLALIMVLYINVPLITLIYCWLDLTFFVLDRIAPTITRHVCIYWPRLCHTSKVGPADIFKNNKRWLIINLP